MLIRGCIVQKFKMWRTSCCIFTWKEGFIVTVCPVLLQAAVQTTVVCFTDMLLLLTVLVQHWWRNCCCKWWRMLAILNPARSIWEVNPLHTIYKKPINFRLSVEILRVPRGTAVVEVCIIWDSVTDDVAWKLKSRVFLNLGKHWVMDYQEGFF